MHITWVNHASFVVSHGDVCLISDPWLFGTAFDDSWALLSPSAFTVDDFEDITHIWLSHEHPDHFSPAVLRAIPEETRARIVVLSQETRDRKVVDYCRNLGFEAVVELPAGSWFELGDDFEVLCQPAPYDDSWIAIRADGKVLLNLNDCLIDDAAMLAAISDQVGAQPDVLLTQFSYASWVGNPDDRAAHQEAAAEAIEKMLTQARVLEPRTVVPFASYVWFCHDENRYLNDSVNTAATAAERLVEAGFEPVVLYPGDEWDVGEPAATDTALECYAADYERCRQQECIHSEAVPFETLAAQAEQFRQRLFAFHGMLLRLFAKAGRPQPAHFWLADLERAVALSLGDGLQSAGVRRADCDVAMSSSALSYVLRNNWGGMTLIINGRYAKPAGGDFKRFERYVHLADWANHGWRMDVELASRVRSAVPFVRRAERWG